MFQEGIEDNLQSIRNLQKYGAIVTPELLARYQKLAPDITLGERSLFLQYSSSGEGNQTAWDQLSALLDRYWDGQIQIDALLAQMDNTIPHWKTHISDESFALSLCLLQSA